MITTAPLPLLTSVPCRASSRPATAPWCRDGQQAVVTPRSSWSLAWLAALRGTNPRIALPAWFCNASLAPLRAMGAQFTFVGVDDQGRPDWSAVQQADLILAVHTFGQIADLRSARAACDRTGAWLVEDCAHVLGPAPGVGALGDYALYSPHKLLALPEGAVLVSNGGALPEIPRLPVSSPWSWLRRRLLQKAIPDLARPYLPQGGPSAFLDDPPDAPLASPTMPSALTLKMMAGAELKREAARRRGHAQALRAALADMKGWQPFFADDGPAPYRFVLRCQDTATASARYAALRAAKLPVETWPDLPPEVDDAQAVALRRSLILLPVHGALPTGYERLYRQALSHV